MTKIWNEAFWKPAPHATEDVPTERQLSRARVVGVALPGIALAAFSIGLSLWAQPALVMAEQIATHLLDPGRYIAAVLGGAQ